MKTWKGDLGKKGFPGRRKTRKGGPGKSKGIKAYDYAPSDHFEDNLLTSIDKLKDSDQFNHLRTKQQIDKMFGDTKVIEEWEPHGIITHSYLSLYKVFLAVDGIILLLEWLSPLYKYLFKVKYKDISLKYKKLFVFFFTLVLFAKKRPMIH